MNRVGEGVVLICLVITIIFDDYRTIGGTGVNNEIPMTEKQASVLPAVLEDARALREGRARCARGARAMLEDSIKESDEGMIASWSEIVAKNDIEHWRACRLVAFLEKLARGEG